MALNCPGAPALRCPDGRKIHAAYVFEVKKPEEAKYPGDYYKLRATIPGGRGFPPGEGGQLSYDKRVIRVTMPADHAVVACLRFKKPPVPSQVEGLPIRLPHGW